ncbi:MAG: hypothetical protein SGPRY_012839 [Prymnesium sp.]
MRPDALHLVVSDMDGTLLAPTTDQGHANGRLTTRSLDCISRLHAAGVRFCIATGRPAPALQAHVDTIGLELPCVCFNGAALLIMRPGTAAHTEWLANYMRLEGVEQSVVKTCEELLELPPPLKARVTPPPCLSILSGHPPVFKITPIVIKSRDPQTRLDSPASAWQMVVMDSEPDKLAAKARATLGTGVHVIAAEMHVEFLPRDVHKATALEWLCEEQGVPLKHVVAFGDNHNDIEMLKVTKEHIVSSHISKLPVSCLFVFSLQASGLGVAMANAKPEVKAAADLTLEWSNADDGVARQCEILLAEGRLRAM